MPRKARDAVAADMPARSATSAKVTLGFFKRRDSRGAGTDRLGRYLRTGLPHKAWLAGLETRVCISKMTV